MKSNFLRIILLASILIVSIILVFRFLNIEEQHLELKTQINPDNQIPSERIWNNNQLNNIHLNTDVNDSLLNAMLIKQFNDTLYIVDYADMKIKRFTKDGDYLDKFGENIGRGPNDFTQIIDISFANENLYAVDAQTQLIKVFDISSKKSSEVIKANQLTIRVLAFHDMKVTLSLSQDLFRTFDQTNNLQHSYGELADKQFANIMSFGGSLLPSENENEFIYVPTYASYLLFYTTDGKYVKSIQTIDKLPFPKSEITGTGVRAPKPDLITQSATYNNKYLLIQYSRRPIEDHSNKKFRIHHSFIDIYSRDGERYLKSILLPQRSAGVNVLGDTLYTINFENRKIEAFFLPEIE